MSEEKPLSKKAWLREQQAKKPPASDSFARLADFIVRGKKMTSFADALKAMQKAGEAMLAERPEFDFGEWAGESVPEIISEVTGRTKDSFSIEERDALLDAYLGY